MTQLHAIHKGVGVVRPTSDIDILLHIETGRGAPRRAAAALEELGYELQPPVDPRTARAHRWLRPGQRVDVAGGRGQVDVVRADHAAPSVVERMRGHDMVPIAGGTQALQRTINATLIIRAGVPTTISVPRAFGAVLLKSAAYLADSRDRDRHLFDAAALLACIDDPFEEAAELRGSDRRRIATLSDRLTEGHPSWRALTPRARANGQAALRILAAA
ncbi:hypothetical protein NF556_15935 [Ornithinimicrobium faecis]|uniref:Nucleotidyltransferase-like protein n=1 Tax=Ornithinimicrobium faecis TaxID=2934158 RepID=A0ABY4YQN8_9MICO|nr:hypothetical protein [Ornithinimicrobium sp. HY1793]USQ79093.1 hypothetical protein NF556_15935 [Ornithinimicrobium sp. HY1793]